MHIPYEGLERTVKSWIYCVSCILLGNFMKYFAYLSRWILLSLHKSLVYKSARKIRYFQLDEIWQIHEKIIQHQFIDSWRPHG